MALWSGEKQKTLAWGELKEYRGERAQRGAVLMRGWREIDRLEAVVPQAAKPEEDKPKK